MSKAFTKEPEAGLDDEAEDDEASADDASVSRAIGGGSGVRLPSAKAGDYITAEGHRALQRELERLWKVERPRVTEEVSVAAAQGDRSENAEYIYGKKKLREIDRRVRFLIKRLDAVTVVVPSPEQRGRVFFGAWFKTVDADDVEATYRIVGTDEHDVNARKISVRSPLAQAVLGKREGDTVVFHRPKGTTEITILEVWYEGLPREA